MSNGGDHHGNAKLVILFLLMMIYVEMRGGGGSSNSGLLQKPPGVATVDSSPSEQAAEAVTTTHITTPTATIATTAAAAVFPPPLNIPSHDPRSSEKTSATAVPPPLPPPAEEQTTDEGDIVVKSKAPTDTTSGPEDSTFYPMPVANSACPFPLELYNYGACNLAVYKANPPKVVEVVGEEEVGEDNSGGLNTKNTTAHNCTLRKEVLGSHQATEFCGYKNRKGNYRGNCHSTEIVANIFYPEKDGKDPVRPARDAGVQSRPYRFFLEIGALDGVDGSTSHFFQFKKGWEGMMVEGSRKYFPLARKSRSQKIPLVTVLNAVACNHAAVLGNKSLAFYEGAGKGMTGLVETYSDKFVQKRFGGIQGMTQKKINKVRCISLSEQVLALNRSHIDFWTLDIEGAELEALNAFDFSKVSVGVIAVELDGTNQAKDNRCRRVFVQKGFQLFMRSEDDEIWYHPRYAEPQGKWEKCYGGGGATGN